MSEVHVAQSIDTGNLKQVKLGKKRGVVHDPLTLKLAKYVDAATLLPKIPSASRVTAQLRPDRYGMFLNDRLGDCTRAAQAHLIQGWQERTRKKVTPTEQDVLTSYERTGYRPGHPETDNGDYLLPALNDWRNNGLGQDKITAFAQINASNHDLVKLGTYLFGGVYLGVNLPLTAQQTGGIWQVQTGPDAEPGSWGGHCVNTVAYGNYVTIVTWGEEQVLTWDWWDKYVDEAYVCLTPDWFYKTAKTPQGLKIDQLQADLDQIGTRKGVTTIPNEQGAVEEVVGQVPGDVRDVEGLVSRKPGALQAAEADVDRLAPLVAPALKEAKAGYKTTEFWLTLVGAVLTQVGALSLPGKYGQTLTTLALLVAYVLSRGLAKAGTPTVDVPLSEK